MEGKQQVAASRMRGAEYERAVHVVTVEQGVSRETLKEPTFWAQVASKLRPWGRLEVRSDDGTFYAEYLVLACDRTWARVHELSYVSLTDADISLTQAGDNYELKWRGPHLKWSAIRKTDSVALQEGFQTKDEAKLWLDGHIKTVS